MPRIYSKLAIAFGLIASLALVSSVLVIRERDYQLSLIPTEPKPAPEPIGRGAVVEAQAFLGRPLTKDEETAIEKAYRLGQQYTAASSVAGGAKSTSDDLNTLALLSEIRRLEDENSALKREGMHSALERAAKLGASTPFVPDVKLTPEAQKSTDEIEKDFNTPILISAFACAISAISCASTVVLGWRRERRDLADWRAKQVAAASASPPENPKPRRRVSNDGVSP